MSKEMGKNNWSYVSAYTRFLKENPDRVLRVFAEQEELERVKKKLTPNKKEVEPEQ